MPVDRVSIFLLRDGTTVESVRGAIEAESGPFDVNSVYPIDAPPTQGVLLVRRGDVKTPDWAQRLQPVAPLLDVRTQSAGAVLLLASGGRIFAIAYGQGRHLLPRGSYERRFGLRAALNGVDPARLRTIAARTFNEHALHTDRQLSRLADVGGFELNTQRDLVTSLAGATLNASLGTKIGGRDSVLLTADLEPHDLAGKCAELLALSRAPQYKTRFPWIDTYEQVDDEREISRLTNLLTAEIAAGNFDRLDLMPPERVSDETVYYRLRPTGNTVVEPDGRLLRHLLTRNGGSAQGLDRRLSNAALEALDGNSDVLDSWSVFDCLHYQHRDGDELVVLDGGDWYRVERGFADDVLTFARTLGSSGLALDNAQQGELEAAYNARIAAARPDLVLVDRRLVSIDGQSPIEPCDLFSDQRHFVHVKRRAHGGSSTLSHLFAQAQVAAEALVLSSDFREKFRGRLDEATAGWSRLVPDPVDAKRFSIVLALMQRRVTGPVAASLPFFSKVNLRIVAQRLQVSGFTVLVDQIETPVTGGTGARPVLRRRRTRRARTTAA